MPEINEQISTTNHEGVHQSLWGGTIFTVFFHPNNLHKDTNKIILINMFEQSVLFGIMEEVKWALPSSKPIQDCMLRLTLLSLLLTSCRLYSAMLFRTIHTTHAALHAQPRDKKKNIYLSSLGSFNPWSSVLSPAPSVPLQITLLKKRSTLCLHLRIL